MNAVLLLVTVALIGPAPPGPVEADIAWVAQGEFCEPETVLPLPDDTLLVSNVCGFAEPGTGFLTLLDVDGAALDWRIVDKLDAPLGMALSGDRLHVVDRNRVKIFRWPGFEWLETVQLETGVANDIAVAPDGTFYISDSARHRVIQRSPDGKFAAVSDGYHFTNANGVALRDNYLYVGGERLWRVSLESGAVTAMGPGWLTDIDGIEFEQDGTLQVTPVGGPLVRMPTDEPIEIYAGDGISSANHGYSRPTGLALVPTGYDNTVIALRVPSSCQVEFMVLGTGQDGGAPQIDNQQDPGWTDLQTRLLAASGALIDHNTGRRFLFEATPDIREQLYALNAAIGEAGNDDPLGLAGVFLTHAHIGHYAGLMFAGHESAGAKNLRVFAMPRMRDFLETNGPWDQLVRYSNIDIETLRNGEAVKLAGSLRVTPLRVPHRDEYSETVGFVIESESKSLLFLPDIDDWDRWQTEYGVRIEDVIANADFAYIDATFFDNNELPGRDMSSIPHPRVRDSMQRFSKLAPDEQRKIRFFHINHTNPLRFDDSEARRIMAEMGFRTAVQNERICLD